MLVMLAIWFSILILIVVTVVILNWDNLFKRDRSSESVIAQTSSLIFYGFKLLD